MKLTVRISEGTTEKEVIKLVKKELNKGKSQSELVREALEVYVKYKNGEFMNDIKEIKELISNIDTDKIEEDDADDELLNSIANRKSKDDFFG